MRTPTSSMLAQLDEQVGRWNLLQHPFYKDWQAGRLDRNALQIYAAQYGRHVKAFPEHLQQLAARCEGETRDLVMENLAEELHPQGPHPQLWRDFACAVGTSEPMLDHSPTLAGVQTLVESYRRICGTCPVAEAVAALYAYEAQVPEIATRKIEGLRHFYGITDSKGLAYFTVHEEADKRHRAAWRQWLEQHGAQNTGVLETADEALRALWGALDSIYSAWSRGSALHSRLKPCLR